MTAHIPVPTDLAFRLLDEVSRRRALTDPESLLLEAIVTQGHQSQGIRFQWTPALERSLWRVSARKGAVRDFAAKHRISEQACYDRLLKMRKRREANKTAKGAER